MKYRGNIYTREQKIILLVLACVVSIVVISHCLIRIFLPSSPLEKNLKLAISDSALTAQITRFEAGIISYDSIRQANDKHNFTPHYTQREIFDFDPNSIDSTQLVKLGFKGWMARNLIKYRQAGGTFRKPSDMKKIYGIDTALVNSLLSNIVIDSIYIHQHSANKPDSTTHASDTTLQINKKHYFTFNLNTADTATLCRLPGIGRARAAKIVIHRQKLGGFYSVNQLITDNILPDSVANSLARYANIDTTLIQKIKVNKSSIRQLKNHPYINYYQAKTLYQMRWDSNHNGTLHPSDILKIKDFTPDDIKRLMPYLDFTTDQNLPTKNQ